MIDYTRFCLPRCSERYEVILPNVAAYAMLKGMGNVAQRLDGHESEVVTAGSAKDALSMVLLRYDAIGSAMDSVIKSIEDAGTETFVEDVGPNPPQRKKMLRFLANYCAAFACDANEGPQYREKFRKVRRKLQAHFGGDKDAIYAEYRRTVSALRSILEEQGHELKTWSGDAEGP
jgi:hypothetical protein